MCEGREHQLAKSKLNLLIITTLVLNLFPTLIILCRLLQKHLIISHIEINLHQTLSLRQLMVLLLF